MCFLKFAVLLPQSIIFFNQLFIFVQKFFFCTCMMAFHSALSTLYFEEIWFGGEFETIFRGHPRAGTFLLETILLGCPLFCFGIHNSRDSFVFRGDSGRVQATSTTLFVSGMAFFHLNWMATTKILWISYYNCHLRTSIIKQTIIRHHSFPLGFP